MLSVSPLTLFECDLVTFKLLPDDFFQFEFRKSAKLGRNAQHDCTKMKQTVILRKNPVLFKQGQGMFTHQLKHLLQKKAVHRYIWDPIEQYPARKLWHTNRIIDHHTYEEKRDPQWNVRKVEVPDQQYSRIPIPPEFKDAYWFRDLQARRIQCPVEWVSYRMYSQKGKNLYDFQDLSMQKKFRFGPEQVVNMARQERN